MNRYLFGRSPAAGLLKQRHGQNNNPSSLLAFCDQRMHIDWHHKNLECTANEGLVPKILCQPTRTPAALRFEYVLQRIQRQVSLLYFPIHGRMGIHQDPR